MKKFSFIDLYAGIGGIRYAFEKAGGKCVFSSEWDIHSKRTYAAFHGHEPNVGDITPVVEELIENSTVIPDHNILTAGFPCQPFSLAGVSKKQSLGRSHGFDDPTQGTEFFKVKEILRIKKPDAFLLENVKNLKGHDKGNTYRVIEEELAKVGYHFKSKVIDAAGWVPQHRERIYIVGVKKNFCLENKLESVFPNPPVHRKILLTDILQSNDDIEDKYTVGVGTWNTLVKHKEYHKSIGQGFGYGLIKAPYEDKVTRTISARYHKDGAEILIDQPSKSRPRRLTPLEACRLQGFPEKSQMFFNGKREQPVSDTQAYRQFGNSVAVPVVTDIAIQLVQFLRRYDII